MAAAGFALFILHEHVYKRLLACACMLNKLPIYAAPGSSRYIANVNLSCLLTAAAGDSITVNSFLQELKQ